jgi:hypothetical protein
MTGCEKYKDRQGMKAAETDAEAGEFYMWRE